MNYEGILTAVICFVCIGLFHPIVIKAEYHFSSRCWPFFLVLGILFLVASLNVRQEIGAIIPGLLGCSCLWSIIELKEQEKRVERGWFPKNPRRGRRKHDSSSMKNRRTI